MWPWHKHEWTKWSDSYNGWSGSFQNKSCKSCNLMRVRVL